MDDLVKKYPSIGALGSRFTLTEVNFCISPYDGLPYDQEPINKYVIDLDACASNVDPAERPEEENGSDLITPWLEMCKKDNDYLFGALDLPWIPPPDLDYVSKDASKTDVKRCVSITDAETLLGDQSYTDWISVWDDLCNRGQKYELKEQDLIWKPPRDLNNLSLVCKSNDESSSSIMTSDGFSGGINPKQILAEPELTDFDDDVLWKDYFVEISKYWFDRHLLFSKYDAGIKMDKEDWFSAIPESIAEHHASRCGKGVVVDCFTGVGGNAIRFSPISTHVIAIDMDPKKIEYAKHNAAIYGALDNIDFITGDFFVLAKKLKADTVFLSTPWGGPKDSETGNFDINMLEPHGGDFLFRVAKQIAPRVVMFLPSNVDLGQLADLALSTSPPWALEVEKNFMNRDLDSITAYFTEQSLVKTPHPS